MVRVEKAKHATPLEVVAGGKLYQVVVDEVITGKALLAKGKLRRRVTIIPLDKIQPRHVSNAACERARAIASQMNSTVHPAIELVGFDEEVRSAMEYVFGGSLVVEGGKAANRVCDETKTRTVTLDGDVYDPSGTISGGSKNNLGTTLAKLSQLASAQGELSEKESRLGVVKGQVNSLKDRSLKYERLHGKLEVARAELAGVERHLSQTKFGMLAEKHDAMSKEIDQAKTEHGEMLKEKKTKWELYCELKGKEEELTHQREARLAQIDQEVKEAKQTAIETAKLAREVSQDCFFLSVPTGPY